MKKSIKQWTAPLILFATCSHAAQSLAPLSIGSVHCNNKLMACSGVCTVELGDSFGDIKSITVTNRSPFITARNIKSTNPFPPGEISIDASDCVEVLPGASCDIVYEQILGGTGETRPMTIQGDNTVPVTVCLLHDPA